MVSIKCQSQYTAPAASLQLLGQRGSGAGSRRPGPFSPQARAPRLTVRVRKPTARSRGRIGRGAPRPRAPWAGGWKQILGYTFAGSRGWGWGREEGIQEAARAQILLFLSPLSPQSELQAYMVKEKKIIKKTYKITIEKVILLGEAPLRLASFVLFLMQFPFRHTSTAFWLRV